MCTPEKISPARPRRRQGFTFVEILAGSAMLAVLLGLMAQITAQSKRQVAAIERNAKALVVLENAMELATALPWDDVDDELAAKLSKADDLTQRWPGAKLACKVTESSDPVPSKQITLTLRTAVAARPVTLTTWTYRTPAPQEDQP